MRGKSKFVLAIIFTAASLCSATNLAVNEGFETAETTSGGWPSTYGDWNGDYSSIVGASSGINPFEGSQMLKYEGTGHSGCGSSANACQVFQIVDVSTLQTLIASGQAIASASAYFNRVAGDAQTDTEFYVQLHAWQGDPGTFPSRWETYTYDATLSYASNFIFTDADPVTWEECSVELPLPTNTDFVVVAVNALEDVFDNTSCPEFDGHFADAVFVTVVPEPMTALLLGLGAVMLHRKRRL